MVEAFTAPDAFLRRFRPMRSCQLFQPCQIGFKNHIFCELARWIEFEQSRTFASASTPSLLQRLTEAGLVVEHQRLPTGDPCRRQPPYPCQRNQQTAVGERYPWQVSCGGYTPAHRWPNHPWAPVVYSKENADTTPGTPIRHSLAAAKGVHAMHPLLRHAPLGRQHPPGTPKMKRAFCALLPLFPAPARNRQPGGVPNTSAQNARLFKKINTVLSNQLVFQNARSIPARRASGARAEVAARRVPALRQASSRHVATRMWPLQNASFFVFFQGLKLTPMKAHPIWNAPV
jgi:hypothetical protein